MSCHALLVTNNPDFHTAISSNVDLRFIDGSALDVLIAARDLAHKGWTLANHPLYGNFRPHQQPYRSLVMLPPHAAMLPVQEGEEPVSPLGFLEEALTLYQSSVRKSKPGDLPGHMRRDCALIDRELLRATLDSLS